MTRRTRQHPLQFAKKTKRVLSGFGDDVELRYAEAPAAYRPKGEAAETFFKRGYRVRPPLTLILTS